MEFEVELKFRLHDRASIESALLSFGAAQGTTETHVDRYFNHPSRDFRQTDEAFRIRSVGAKNCVTYKGAVVGNVAKTRHEVEVGFASGAPAADQLATMVNLLGFRFVREVRKTRRSLSLDRNGRQINLAIDDVPPLGQFLEIELIADDSDRQNAEAAVWELARALRLVAAESRSYLDLLLESDGDPR